MSFFTQASFVMDPNVYGVGKLYVPKPTDGSGDLTFTRASNGTRVNQDGLIEKVRTNLLTYSNDFSNAAWNKIGGTTLTAGQSDYLGGTNAWKFEATGAGVIQLSQNPAAATIRTSSIYAKAGSVSTFNLWVGSAVTFNLSTGTVTSGTGVITSVGNGWYRCSAFGTSISHNPYFISASAGDYVLISFAQLETGDIATDYIPTTSAAVSVGPLANIPRLNYGADGCPSLLLEPQRSNLALWSEAFGNAIWNVSNLTVTSNTSETLDPSGYYGAEKITSNSLTGNHFIRQAVTVTASTTYTSSVFIKAGNTNVFSLADGYNINILATFDLSAVTATNVNGTNAKIESVGNGWYRCSASMVPTSTTMGLMVYSGTTYAGTETDKYYYIWGAQVEAGSYATSYIPTLGASVSRLADSAFRTGVSSLIGQTEGTIFVDFDFTNSSGVQVIFTIHDNSNSKRIEFWANSAILNGFIGGSVNITVGASTITNGRHKVALAYKQSGDHAFYIDGVQIGTSSTPSTIAAFTALIFDYWGSGFLEQKGVRQTLIFKTRLTNADLARLTSL